MSRKYLKEAEKRYEAGDYRNAGVNAMLGLGMVDTKRAKKKAPEKKKTEEKKPAEKGDLLEEIEEKEKEGTL
jgi:hypothetical protein